MRDASIFSVRHVLIIVSVLAILVVPVWITYAIGKRFPPNMRDKRSESGVGGWLLWLIWSGIFLGPLILFVAAVGLHNQEGINSTEMGVAPQRFGLLIGDFYFAAVALSSMAFGLTLLVRRTPIAVTRAKQLIWIEFLFGMLPCLALFLPLGERIDASDLLKSEITSLFLVVIWTLYLSKSKRVALTYGLEKKGLGASRPEAPQKPIVDEVADPAISLSDDRGRTDRARGDVLDTDSMDTISTAQESFWEVALEEVDGPLRRKGVWEKAFAMASGDEAAAKVAYLKARVQQMVEECDNQMRLDAQAALDQEQVRQTLYLLHSLG